MTNKNINFKYLLIGIVTLIITIICFFLVQKFSFGRLIMILSGAQSVSSFLMAFNIDPFKGLKFDNSNFINKFLSGNFPLPASFWGIYIIYFQILFAYIATMILVSLGVNYFYVEIFTIIIALVLIVGVWNSARKYKGKKLWKFLTFTLLSINAIAMSINLVLKFLGIDINQL